MTPSAVSQIIRALECQAGVTLLHRSTRKLALTEAGARCYPHCLRLLEAGSAAAAALEQARDAPTGELRVAAPVGFAAHIAVALAPVLSDWPMLRLRLIVDDALIDLIDARIDVALRVGELADSSWIGRKLCDFEPILCASPAYLERHGLPTEPADLAGHSWLATASVAGTYLGASGPEQALPLVLTLRDTRGAVERVEGAVRIATTNQIALQQVCEQGMGIASLYYPDVRASLERGVLMRLLPRWSLPSRPVTMVTPRRDGDPAKVRVALQALTGYFAETR